MSILEALDNIFVGGFIRRLTEKLSPVTNALAANTVLDNATISISEILSGKAQRLSTYPLKGPLSPVDAYNAAWNFVGLVEPQLTAAALAAVGVEALSYGQVDVSVDALNNMPYILDDKQIALQTRTAEFNFGAMPALQRYYLAKTTPLLPESYR